MNTKEIKQIKEILAVLKGLSLSKIEKKPDDRIFLHFGEMIEIDSRSKKDEHGKSLRVLSGEYAIQIMCFFRFCHNDEIIMASGDSFEQMDDIILSKLTELGGFTVDALKVLEFGDVSIKFTNRFSLDIRTDISEYEWCWRFFRSTDNYDLLAVTGKSIEIQSLDNE
jgi:hypothetical protein